jgi:hypothetical protein
MKTPNYTEGLTKSEAARERRYIAEAITEDCTTAEAQQTLNGVQANMQTSSGDEQVSSE